MNNQQRFQQITQQLQTLRTQYDQAQGQLAATLASVGATDLAHAEAMLEEAEAQERQAAQTFEGLLDHYEQQYKTTG